MSIFKPITNKNELQALVEQDKANVGVTRSGDLYTFDFENNKPEKISLEQAGEKLGLELDIIAEISKSGGHFIVPIPIIVEKKEPTPGDQKDENDNHKEDENDDHEENETPKKQLEVEVKFSMEQFEKIIKPLIDEIKGLKDELESDRKLAKTRYEEFKHLESKILL